MSLQPGHADFDRVWVLARLAETSRIRIDPGRELADRLAASRWAIRTATGYPVRPPVLRAALTQAMTGTAGLRAEPLGRALVAAIREHGWDLAQVPGRPPGEDGLRPCDDW